jgi:hypothetical protein
MCRSGEKRTLSGGARLVNPNGGVPMFGHKSNVIPQINLCR